MMGNINKYFVGVVIFILILSVFINNKIIIQPTGSLAKGIYFKSEIQRPLKVGDIVLVSFKKKDLLQRPNTYPLPKEMPWHSFIKIISGVPGDVINISDDGFFVNEKYYGPVHKVTSKGKPLKRVLNGEYRLKNDWYFVTTPHNRSYDSRYFGPVHISQLQKATPWLLVPWDNNHKKKGEMSMDRDNAMQALNATMEASGVLKYIMQKNITDICVNPDGRLWVDELGIGRKFTGIIIPPAMVEAILRTAASYVGDVITRDKPNLAADLECYGFARLEGSIYPVTSSPQFAIRMKAILNYTLDDLCEKKDMLTPEQVKIIKNIIETSEHMIVSGSTGCGKTTLLNAMLKRMKNDRIITLETERELDTSCIEDTVAMKAFNDPNSMKRSVRAALRLRPDRIIIGEIMGAEAYSLMVANRTGHNGSVCSIHAKSPKQAMNQLEDYINESHLNNVSKNSVADTVDIIVQIKKDQNTHKRKVTEITRVHGFNGNEYMLETIG